MNKTMKKSDMTAKTAAVVLWMNIGLTGFKFLVYSFSGSLAVLAEAWHSFTDIATSGLVLIAVRIPKKEENNPGVSRPEIIVSLVIGLLLLGISMLLFRKVLGAESRVISKPVISGIIFLVFAMGSFLVGAFETRVGRKQGSIGLVSDGMHARADMAASLLTGFSLILYAMGLDIDRWIAGIIALFIFSLALEILLNVFRVWRSKSADSLYAYRFFDSLVRAVKKGSVKGVSRYAEKRLLDRIPDERRAKRIHRCLAALPMVLLCAGYLSTAVYQVAPGETAIIERLGRPVNEKSPVMPGLHLKLPWPFDREISVLSMPIREISIGNITDKESRAYIWTLEHGTQEAFLSGDNHLFYPYIILHYTISNPFDYLYTAADPGALLDGIGHQAATAVFAGEPFYDIAARERRSLEMRIRQIIQEKLDSLNSGIHLISVNFKDIHPPISIADSYEAVIAGLQEKQELMNRAAGYANTILPESRGQARETVEKAHGDHIEKTSRAQAEAERFVLTLPGTPLEKRIMKSEIYLDSQEKALKDKNLVIIDPKAGAPDVWMDFNRIPAESEDLL